MKRICLILLLLTISIQSQASVLVFSTNGTYVPKTSLSSASTASDAAGKTIVVNSPITIDNVTIPLGTTLKIENGGQITINSGKVLTINGTLVAGIQQVFYGTGTVVFGQASVTDVYPQWWGAYSNNTNPTITTAALNAAFTSTNASLVSRVRLIAGTYSTNAPLNITGQIMIVGDGKANTAINVVGSDGIHIDVAHDSIIMTGFTIKASTRYTSSPNSYLGLTIVNPATGSYKHIYRDMMFDGWGTAVSMSHLSEATFDNVTIIFGHVGFSFSGTQANVRTTIVNCNVELDATSGSYGMVFGEHTEGCHVANSLFYNTQIGLLAYSSNDNYLINNEFDYFTDKGMYLLDQVADPRNMGWSIIGNYFSTAAIGAESGIRIDKTYTHASNIGNRIIGNTIQTYQGSATCSYGIRLTGAYGTNNIIDGNNIKFMATNDILDATGGAGNIISNNACQSAITNNISGGSIVTNNSGTVAPANVTHYASIGPLKIIYSNSIPTTGTWTQGTVCINTAAVVGQPKGWRCTVAGSPGTWVSEGNL